MIFFVESVFMNHREQRMRSGSRISVRVRISALVAAVSMALLLAAPPVSAQTLPAPTLSLTWYLCQVTLSWTHSNPDGLNIYNYPYRIRSHDGVWNSWNNISGGAASRQATVLGLPDGGNNAFQVRATAKTVGYFIHGPASNSVTASLLDHEHVQCKVQAEQSG